MGLLDKLFKRPLTQEQFARMLMKRIRASGDTQSVQYDPEFFSLRNSPDRVSFLNNFYQEYLRLPKSEHERLIRTFLTSWHTTGFKPPAEFDDARPDLLPVLRPRSYFEIDAHRVANNLRSQIDIPYAIIADHLVGALVYDLPQTMMSVNNELLDQWGVSFYAAMEVAKQNLRDKPMQYAQIGQVYLVATGDSYDATRMLLTDFVRQFDVPGNTLVMVPNRERLYVCGTEDGIGLEIMLKMATEDFKHERNISGMVFRLSDDDWEVWLPPKDHPTFGEFKALQLQTFGTDYAAQKDLLDKRHQHEGRDIFVATFTAIENTQTQRLTSYCTWSAGVDSLLPETDSLALVQPDAPKDQLMAAFNDWQRVKQVVGNLMEPQGMYPERWRVREFPSKSMLQEIGNTFNL